MQMQEPLSSKSFEEKAKESMNVADHVLEAVLKEGSQVLYNKYLQPKVRPYSAMYAARLVCAPASVSLIVLLISEGWRTFK